ncbi:MAG: hypothetical protein EBZ40_05375, partial [Gammaproteobacteria bacterium]|nr:hypothetical protein [Gammaproteobacteria bacterium]
ISRERQVAYINFRHLWKHSLKTDMIRSLRDHLIDDDSALQLGAAQRVERRQKGNDHLRVYHNPRIA